jgi:hypothetical protein
MSNSTYEYALLVAARYAACTNSVLPGLNCRAKFVIIDESLGFFSSLPERRGGRRGMEFAKNIDFQYFLLFWLNFHF